MKSGTFVYKGLTSTEQYYPYYNVSNNTLNESTRVTEVVTHGPLIRGFDRHHPNNWSFSVREDRIDTGKRVVAANTRTINSNTNIVTVSGVIGIGFNLNQEPAPNMGLAANEALSRLNDAVRGGLDLSQSAGELPSTLRMIRAVARWKRWFKGLGPKRWANEYLELKYGWLPLLNDIYTAVDMMKKEVDSKLTFKSSARAECGPLASQTFFIGGSVQSVVRYKSCRAGVKYQVTMKVPRSNQDIARWTSLNPLGLAWELMPYSFVIDWFYDVGSYLRDYETALMYNTAFSHGFVTHLRAWDIEHSLNTAYKTDNSYGSISTTGGRKRIQFTRSVLPGYPIPTRPVLKIDLSSSSLLSAAALLVQQLRR